MDWLYQGAQEKVELVRSYGLPIWVMEPLRGGTLAEFHPEDAAFLEAVRPGETAPGWAFRFLQGLSEVSVVLSGMSTMEQLRENVALFGENVPLKTEETESLLAVARNILKRTTVFCTDCRYCVSHCPQGLNIPALVRLYNECAFSGQPGAVCHHPFKRHFGRRTWRNCRRISVQQPVLPAAAVKKCARRESGYPK